MDELALKNLGPLAALAGTWEAFRFKRVTGKSRLGSLRQGRPATTVARARGAT